MTAGIESIGKLFDGYGISDAYGGETVLLHDSEIEKIARENRAVTRGSDNPRGWPSDSDARAAFRPLIGSRATLESFRREYQYVQERRGHDPLGLATKKSAWIEAAMLAILDACDDAEFGE